MGVAFPCTISILNCHRFLNTLCCAASPVNTSLMCWRRPRPGVARSGHSPNNYQPLRCFTLSILMGHASTAYMSPAPVCPTPASATLETAGATEATAATELAQHETGQLPPQSTAASAG